MLILKVDGSENIFCPGANIAVEAGWRQQDPPDHAAVRLFWYTDGDDLLDTKLCGEQILEGRGNNHKKKITMQLPEAPFSCSGPLFSIRWAIELVLNGGEQAKRVDIRVAPWDEAPCLEASAITDPLFHNRV